MRNIRSSGGRESGEEFLSESIEHLTKFWIESRQIFRGGVPNNIRVHADIIVNELVPHSSYFTPWDLRMFFTNCRRNFPNGFTNDFQTTNHGELRFIVRRKIFQSHPLNELGDLRGGFQNVTDIVCWRAFAFHTKTISLTTFLLTRGLRESSVSKSTLTPSLSDK